LIFAKGAQNMHWGKDSLLISGVGKTEYSSVGDWN
jgi:hypothetical protein